jgi:ribosomal protein L24
MVRHEKINRCLESAASIEKIAKKKADAERSKKEDGERSKKALNINSSEVALLKSEMLLYLLLPRIN